MPCGVRCLRRDAARATAPFDHETVAVRHGAYFCGSARRVPGLEPRTVPMPRAWPAALSGYGSAGY